ncbi:hypothetical protein DICPUDRAFT_82352 [Dictyostelium purpureum]|uniref:Uncharacterized protein n=1 Tax=Dictyostelium purpureum TaxID=5786 RepID=F0ZW99_DICPU|nr:uncharacterized protein DICPUDRAFT_82352 [Dictyostelium purpureum]EGC31770.1 hypothetical protein DICPUDRAFT_82352 [Dictyostelium purpureum]|eukprot:XP_003291693.1 hypothetical protein DICPUDRAFT_82352 [Dictyostelium purpureum]
MSSNKELNLEEQYEELFKIVKKKCKTLIPNISAKGYFINELSTLAKTQKEKVQLKQALDEKFQSIESGKYCYTCFTSKNDIIMTNKFTKYALFNQFDCTDNSLTIQSVKPVCDKCFKLLDFKYVFEKISQYQIERYNSNNNNNNTIGDDEDECITLIRHFALLNKIDILQPDWKERVQEIFTILFSLYNIINNLPSVSIKVGGDSKNLFKYNTSLEVLKQL